MNNWRTGGWRAGVAIAITAAAAAAPGPATDADAFGTVLSRFRQQLLDGRLPDVPQATKQLATIRPDGTFSGIDYADQEAGMWQPGDAIYRARIFARLLVDQRSPMRGDPRLATAVRDVVHDWVARRYHAKNWWWNDIGVPEAMRDVLVLAGDEIAPADRAGALAVVAQRGTFANGGGANTIWQAELALHDAAFTGDATLAARASKAIADEIHLTTKEGIQSDRSFYAHGAHNQTFHYGGAYTGVIVGVAAELRGTPWALPPAKLDLIADYVLNGQAWMCRGTYCGPGPLDRSVGRRGSFQSADLTGSADRLAEMLPGRAAALRELAARQRGTAPPLVGFRYFPRSDYACYQRPGFAYFVGTISTRTRPPEATGNGDDMLGQRVNDGDGYALRDGPEYADLQPVWDWSALPGLTYAAGAGGVQQKPFAGAAGDGPVGTTTGAAGMELAFADRTRDSMLSAHKFWAFHGDAVVCLVGPVASRNLAGPVHTTLDQCHLDGPVVVDGKPVTGDVPAVPVGSVWHHGLAYVPIGGLPVTLHVGDRTGSWQRVESAESKAPVTEAVMFAEIEHPAGQAGGFAVTAAATPADAARLAAAPPWTVVENDDAAQAMTFADGTVTLAAYAPATVGPVRVDRPCVAVRVGGVWWASDPAHGGGPVTLVDAGRTVTATLPADGTSVRLR